jgi:hypothetical protein
MHKGNQDKQLEEIDERKFGNDLKNLKQIFQKISMESIIKNCESIIYFRIYLLKFFCAEDKWIRAFGFETYFSSFNLKFLR